MKNYNLITRQPSDQFVHYVDRLDEATLKNIVFTNKLPIDIYVFQEHRWVETTTFAGVIKANSTLNIDYNSILDGDVFHFKGNDTNRYYFACPSYNITKRHGNVLVGAVAAYPETYLREVSPGGDISSIHVHNMLPWPIILKHKGKPVMYVERNADLGDPLNHSDLTLSPSVYYDNLNQGINVGTKFDVYIVGKINATNQSVPPPQKISDHYAVGDGRVVLMSDTTYLYSFEINDTDEDHIFIGLVIPMIDASIATGVSNSNFIKEGKMSPKNTTGRAIYRLGKEYTGDKPFIPGEVHYDFKAKNATSKNPLSKHLMLSGANTINGLYL